MFCKKCQVLGHDCSLFAHNKPIQHASKPSKPSATHHPHNKQWVATGLRIPDMVSGQSHATANVARHGAGNEQNIGLQTTDQGEDLD